MPAMIDRRELMAALGSAAVAWPMTAHAQQPLPARYRLPTIYVNDTAVKEGGFVSYGADEDEPNRLVGNFAGRILKGEKPADIPVQLLTRMRLLINLKTAKDLGITVSTPLLGRADEVIE